MLESLHPAKLVLGPLQFVPPFLSSLISAAEEGRDLRLHVESITRNLGFDGFMYGATKTPKPERESKSYVYTTLSQDWIDRYDEMAYIEADPRLALTWNSAVPLIWDHQSLRGRSNASDCYLDDAMRHGVCSGVCFMFHGPQDSHMFVSLSSRIVRNDSFRLQAIARNLPDIVMFGHYFHEVFMRSVIPESLGGKATTRQLSKRERECLTMAARGLTTSDIAIKLAISARTVQFHFDNIRTKLDATNRQESIAIAIESGIIRVG